MLLFGSFLLSVVLVTAQSDFKNRSFKVCIQEGRVMSVEPKGSDETLTNGCSKLIWLRYREIWETNTWIRMQLDQSNITDFEKGWYRVHDFPFDTLILNDNNISEITSNLINDLPESITEVHLERNKVERLRNGTIANEHLLTLLLNSNSLQVIESGALENLTRLQRLTLDHNRLHDTKFVATLPLSLQALELRYNEITEISAGSFSKLHELMFLTFEGNKITEIQRQAFQSLTKLFYLAIDLNPIERIENGSFAFSDRLQHVSTIGVDVVYYN